MPRMPDWTDAPRSRATTPNVPRTPKDFVGEAAGRLGETIAREAEASEELNLRIAKQQRNEGQALEYAAAKADFAKRRINEEDGYRPEVNPRLDKWEGQYTKNLTKHKAASAALISDPNLRLRFEFEADEDITRGSVGLRGKVRDYRMGEQRARGLQAIEDTLILAAKPGLPQDEVNRLFIRARADIDNLVMAGVMKPEQAVEQRRSFSKRFATAKVQEDILADPGNAYRNIKGGAAGEVYYRKLLGKENASGSNYARPKKPNGEDASSALGRYQFTTGTWADVMKAHPELGLTADGRTNADQQERAIRAFTSDNAAFLQSKGIPVSEATLYMAHFMGAKGAVDMFKAAPGANASALFPESAKANPTIFFAGKGENMRPRTVAEVIALQTKNFSTQDAPAPAYYEMLDPEDRVRFSTMAEAEYASRAKAEREADALKKYQTKSLLEDDISQIANTGKPSDIDPSQVAAVLGEDDAVKWLEDRQSAANTFAAVSAMDTMTNDQIEDHLSSLEPQAGAANFKDAQKTYDAAERRAKSLLDLRLKDPAKSVEESALVNEAKKGLDPAQPQTVQALARARLAAQEQVGIPKAMRQPVTRAEARQIIAPIERVIDMTDAQIVAATGSAGADKAARKASIRAIHRQAEEEIRNTVDQIEAAYGPYADQVLAFAIAESVRDKEIGDLASRVFKKIASGQRVTSSDTEGLDQANEAATADKAMTGEGRSVTGAPQTASPGSGSQPTGQPQKASPAPGAGTGRGVSPRALPPGRSSAPAPGQPPAKDKKRPAARDGSPWPSRKDVQTLLKNPALASEFDKIYGAGRAAEWLPQE